MNQTRTPKVTPACAALKSWLTSSGLRYRDLAERLGVTVGAVQGWVRGDWAPELETMVVLAEITEGSVSVESWADPVEVGELRRRAAERGPAPPIVPRWYLSAKAIREYLEIVGRPDDDGGPEWGRAERELAALCESAHHVGPTASGMQRWRTGKPLRLQLIVSTARRPEGDLDQLVSVRR